MDASSFRAGTTIATRGFPDGVAGLRSHSGRVMFTRVRTPSEVSITRESHITASRVPAIQWKYVIRRGPARVLSRVRVQRLGQSAFRKKELRLIIPWQSLAK